MEMQELCLEGMHCSMPSTVIYKPCHLFTSPVTCLQALTFVYKPWHLFTSPDVCLQALTSVYKPWPMPSTVVYKPWHCQIFRVGQNHIYTVYIRYFWQGNHQIYGHIRCKHTVLANPTNIQILPWGYDKLLNTNSWLASNKPILYKTQASHWTYWQCGHLM
jgi:hypothetical protein